ncbi:MAG: DUF2971 domain-containing protein [Beijerinckiaceae bacterium]|nr:MAG: DUF2971 domain-containing protein [Beijerinckiaceae bacterium]
MAEIETSAKPATLYRYRPLGIRRLPSRKSRAEPAIIDRELDAIEQHYVFCPTYPEMNDPMECLYASMQRVQEKSDYQDFVPDVRDKKLGIGIASFCEAWDNEVMWAHYAGGFRGICVAYSVSKLMDGLDDRHSLVRIVYGDSPFNMNLAGRRDRSGCARAILSAKNLMWTYEREWRLFAPFRGRAQHGPGVVKRVYLGARMDPADRRIITGRLLSIGLEVRRTRVDGDMVERLPPSKPPKPRCCR